MLNRAISRRQFWKAGSAAAAARLFSSKLKLMRAFAATQGPGLSNPAGQPKFKAVVPNAWIQDLSTI